MTTTELIEILRQNEFGGASGRPREVSFCVGDRIISTDGIEVIGSGDGLITDLDLSLPDAEPKRGYWYAIERGEHGYSAGSFRCSVCGEPNRSYSAKPNFCGNCGADMRGGGK